MRKTIWITTLFLTFLLISACGSGESGGSGGMDKAFKDMENGIRNQDESLFKKHWTADGYEKNLVGGSGMPGSKVYSQGSRKKWYLAADFTNPETIGKVRIYRCDIYAWEKEKKVDEIYLATNKDDSKVIGGGEDLAEVKALAERYNAGKPLEAK